MQRHVPSLPKYSQINCPSVVAMLFKSVGITSTICLKLILQIGILSIGGFLTLSCDTDTAYRQSLWYDFFFCSFPSELVCIISGRYTPFDIYIIFSAAMICLPSLKFCALVNDTFPKVPSFSHSSRWRDSNLTSQDQFSVF